MPREVFWSPPSLGSKITSTTCSWGCSPQYNHKFWNSKSSVKRQGVLSVSMSSLILSLLPWSILFVVSGGGRAPKQWRQDAPSPNLCLIWPGAWVYGKWGEVNGFMALGTEDMYLQRKTQRTSTFTTSRLEYAYIYIYTRSIEYSIHVCTICSVVVVTFPFNSRRKWKRCVCG